MAHQNVLLWFCIVLYCLSLFVKGWVTVIFYLKFETELMGRLTAYFRLLLLPVDSDKVIRIFPASKAHLDLLNSLEERDDIKVDFWQRPGHLGQAVDVRLSEADYTVVADLLSRESVHFTVQIVDVQALVDRERLARMSRASGWHSQYHKLSEIHSQLNKIARRYSKMARVFSLGNSHGGWAMKALEIKGRKQYKKPVLFMECGIHAREWISPATCMYLIDQLTYKYGKDSSVTALLDKLDVVVLPVLNVDGYQYTWTNDRMWRKNRRYVGRGCYGVDLNRNWGYKWGGAGASRNPCYSTYRGRSAFSEIESRNVANYLRSLGGRLKGFIDFHAYSQMWFTPWGYSRATSTDYSEQLRVAKKASQAIGSAGYNTYFQYGSSAKLLYAASGGSEDWVYAELGVKYSFSVELRDRGRHGFLLPPEQIIPTGIETLAGLKALVSEMRI